MRRLFAMPLLSSPDGIIAGGDRPIRRWQNCRRGKSSADLNHILNGNSEEAKQGDSQAEAQFAQHIEMTTGLFPTSAFYQQQRAQRNASGDQRLPQTHTVQENDSIDNIAESFALSQLELRAINPDLGEDDLQTGNILMVISRRKCLRLR